MPNLAQLWLEITGKCQLECAPCYPSSGPHGTHGAMARADWVRVIDQAAALGVGMITFIGGEPTLHEDLVELVEHVRAHAVPAEVYTNLVHVTDEHWRAFARHGVSLATSWYSDDPAEHQRIVRRPTHARTLANIARARELGIPVRAGLVRVLAGQRIEAATRVLAQFGISRVRVDSVRGVGRGAAHPTPDASALCGRCADGRLAIGPDGDAWPCVFGRWLPVGNAREQSLIEILAGARLATVRDELEREFAARRSHPGCDPVCPPEDCIPNTTCSPMGDCDPGPGTPPLPPDEDDEVIGYVADSTR